VGVGNKKMKKIDFKRILIGLAVVSILSVMPTLTAFGQENSVSKTDRKAFPVKAKYVNSDGKEAANMTVYFAYFDEKESALVELTDKTGSDGSAASFKVPFSDEKGATYAFVVLTSKDDLGKVKAAVGKGNVRMFRIPPGENCKELVLTISASGGIRNDGCSIQMAYK